MKNWSKVVLNNVDSYKIKIMKDDLNKGYELLVINEVQGTYEVIDSDSKRTDLIKAREVFKELLLENYPTAKLTIDKSVR